LSSARYAGNPFFVLGFHGCDRAVGESVLAGEVDLQASKNNHDWLGHGIYFWENNVERAKRWAAWLADQPWSSVQDPFVIGAIVDLGHCLSLLQEDGIALVTETHRRVVAVSEAGRETLPQNDGFKLQRLDCHVIQTLHRIREVGRLAPFDTVRGMFPEGKRLYADSGFRDQNHIQISVRSRRCIKGYFRPIA